MQSLQRRSTPCHSERRASAGEHDNGVGETQDWLTVLEQMRSRYASRAVILAGFSFGGFVQSRVARHLSAHNEPPRCLVLIAPAVGRFAVLLAAVR